MIGQPGIVGEKVKKFTVTPFARIMYETISVFVDFLHISFCLSKGEDGEAGDPGSVGVPGRIVSLFPPFGGHIFIKAPSDLLPAASVFKLLLLFSSTTALLTAHSAPMLL